MSKTNEKAKDLTDFLFSSQEKNNIKEEIDELRSRIIGLEQNIDISDEILNLIALSKQNGEVGKDPNNNWVMKISNTNTFSYCETGDGIDRSNTIDQILRKSTVCTRLKQIFDQCGFDYYFKEKNDVEENYDFGGKLTYRVTKFTQNLSIPLTKYDALMESLDCYFDSDSKSKKTYVKDKKQ